MHRHGVQDDPVDAALCLAQVLDVRKITRQHPIQWTVPSAVAPGGRTLRASLSGVPP